MNNKIKYLIMLIVVSTILNNCGQDSTFSDRTELIKTGAIISSTIYNDDDSLTNELLTVKNDTVYLDTAADSIYGNQAPLFASPAAKRAKKIEGTDLILVAEVAPPTYQGSTLQATNITNQGDFVFVSFNTQGDTYLGALQDIQLTNSRNPRLISEVIYHHTDVSALTYLNPKQLVLAMATNTNIDTQFTDPAAMGVINLGSKFEFDDNAAFKGLVSYAATSVEVNNDKIYILSGDGGGLTIFNASSFDSLAYIPVSDARDLDFYGDTLYVYSGTPGTLYKISTVSYNIADSFALSGSNKTEEKSSIEINGRFAFIAANDSGVQVFDLEQETIAVTLPNPEVAGLAADKVVANAMTVDDDLLFIANGEAGVRVFKNTTGDIDKADSVNFQEEGFLILGLKQSANEIYCRNKYLVVASGTGGVKIIKVED